MAIVSFTALAGALPLLTLLGVILPPARSRRLVGAQHDAELRLVPYLLRYGLHGLACVGRVRLHGLQTVLARGLPLGDLTVEDDLHLAAVGLGSHVGRDSNPLAWRVLMHEGVLDPPDRKLGLQVSPDPDPLPLHIFSHRLPLGRPVGRCFNSPILTAWRRPRSACRASVM